MSFTPASTLVADTRPTDGDSRHGSSHLGGDQILVPLLTPDRATVSDQLRAAASFGRTTGGSLHVVNPATASRGDEFDLRQEFTAGDEQQLLEWAMDHAPEGGPGPRGDGFAYTRGLLRGILGTIETTEIDTLVVPSGSQTGLVRRGLVERLALRADCNVITVNGQHGYGTVPSILLPVAGGPHSGLATDVADRIGADFDAWIDVLHVVDPDAPDRRREQARAHVDAAAQRIGRPESTSTWVLESPDVADAIVEQSQYYGLTVVGAPTKGRLRRFIAGSTNRQIRSNAHSVVLSARNNRA